MMKDTNEQIREQNPLTTLSLGEKEDLERKRVLYAKKLGMLLDQGVKDFGIEWTIGLVYVGIQHRIERFNIKNTGIFGFLKGLFK